MLVALLIVTTPGVWAALLLPLILAVGVLWILGRLGLLTVLGLVLPRPRLRTAGPSAPVMAFRCDGAAGVADVRLRGHEAGVALGDRVTVRGVRLGGVLHAVQLANHSTGTVLWSDGLIGTAAIALLDLWLLASLLEHLR